MDLNKLAKLVARYERGKIQMDIAQIKEVLFVLCFLEEKLAGSHDCPTQLIKQRALELYMARPNTGVNPMAAKKAKPKGPKKPMPNKGPKSKSKDKNGY